jgi:hypothetical protein
VATSGMPMRVSGIPLVEPIMLLRWSVGLIKEISCDSIGCVGSIIKV